MLPSENIVMANSQIRLVVTRHIGAVLHQQTMGQFRPFREGEGRKGSRPEIVITKGTFYTFSWRLDLRHLLI
jgi:hypothetical protein